MTKLAAMALQGCRLDNFVRQFLKPEILDFATGAPLTFAPRAFRLEAARAVAGSLQGYGDSAGLPALRAALAAHLARIGFEVEPDREIAITIGATGALQAAFLAVAEPGDEVLVPVPGYEPVFDIIRLAGAKPVPVTLEEPSWELSTIALRRAITPRTCAIYVNQPSNPTGRIFTNSEMESTIAVCREFDLVAIEDAVYAEFFFSRPPLITGADARMRDRVIHVGSFSKSYAIPGWRLGYAAATGRLGEQVRRISETMTGGAVAPLQQAVIAAGISTMDFVALRSTYHQSRDHLVAVLSGAGFRAPLPDGGIYVFAECPPGLRTSELLERGVATMPGSFFYPDEDHGSAYARFCFARPLRQIHALESVLPRRDSANAPTLAVRIQKGITT